MRSLTFYYGGGSSREAEKLEGWLQEKEHPDAKYVTGDFILSEDRTAGVRFAGVPSQCGMAMLYTFAYSERNSLKELLQRAERIAHSLRYSSLMATMPKESRSTFSEVMESEGWSVSFEWYNRRSGYTNFLWTKFLERDDDDENFD